MGLSRMESSWDVTMRVVSLRQKTREVKEKARELPLAYFTATTITATTETASVTQIPPIRTLFHTLSLLTSLSLFFNELSNSSH